MFQKSLLKNFVKAFTISDSRELKKLCSLDGKIDEDANGAEFLLYLAKFLGWQNCTREVKNHTDMKKADGVVYNTKNEPIAIIELKSSDKKISNRDIIAQAFRYKNEKPTCRYVVVSNFKSLDIYCDSSDVCFSLDMTDLKNYTTLYALLCQSSLETNEIARLKKISKSQEEITKEVYKEYSSFRLKLLNNLIENNKELSKEDIFESANKLLDRFMFILFAEDRGLIPANSIDAIIKQYENNQEWGDGTPLYSYYKKYFLFIDEGNDKVNIPRYNGNLFKPDRQLENLIIDDHIIKTDLSHLSAYDFSNDVGVEVLGHIFEQSLNDLEVIKESLIEEHKIVNTRKKDGVFYTPKFITQYIINNTVASTCKDKKEELALHVEIKDTKRAKEKRRETLHVYAKFLEGLKIVDPACGSGAFLTACFRYLLDEHKWIQKELGKAGAGLFEHHDIDKQIIENNLFGVDINGASVGIAKLSLWLQTAKRNRPLSNLMGNIKSANSLTCNWDELFPEIMANGGFDCVVGNSPYVRQESIKELKPQLKEIYSVFTGTADLFVYFYELAQNILKVGGINGFICSNKFFRAKYGQNLREMILTKTNIKAIVDFNGVKVFEDATVDSAITVLQKGFQEDNHFNVSFKDYKHFFRMQQSDLNNDGFTFISPAKLYLKKKIERIGTPLSEWDVSINSGIKTGFNEAFIIDGAKKDELIKLDRKNEEIIKPLLRGRDIKKYSYEFADKWLINTHNNPPINIEEYPIIKEHLNNYYEKLEKRTDKGITPYNLRNCAYIDEFKKEKILWIELSDLGKFTLDTKGYYVEMTVFFMIGENLKFLLALLNSKMIFWYFDLICAESGVGTNRWKKTYVKQLPIQKIPKSLQEYQNNISKLLEMPKKAKYDKDTKYAIASLDNKDIYTTEFLFAKNRGWIQDLSGHKEILKEYLKLITYIFTNKLYDEILENIKDGRKIYSTKLQNCRFFHIIDENNFLVSYFVMGNLNFGKQLNKRFRYIHRSKREGGHFSILSPARPFWRHLDLIKQLYQNLSKISITQKPFIDLVDIIIESKQKIAKYKKHFDSLNAVDKIEIKEEIEKLETLVLNSVDKIDSLVYELYGLNKNEIKIIEDK